MTTIVTYTIQFTDAVTGQVGKVHFPAVSPLMAQAWAELCFKNNTWDAVELRAHNEVLWVASK